jgi:hypothetical protein
MRAKILEMIDLLVSPFDAVIDGVAVDGMEGVEPDLVPEPVQQMVTFIKEKLGANRAGYEDAMVAVVEKYLAEEDVDAVLAFNKSATGTKLRGVQQALQDDLMIASANWRNSTLEPHVEEVKRMIGATEPAPAPLEEAPTPPASPEAA